MQHGLPGLQDLPRSGRPPKYDQKFRNNVLKLLSQSQPKGLSAWDGPTLAEKLEVPADAVWKVLRNDGIHLQRQRSWCISTDKDFAAKAADIVGLYLDPPFNAIVLCVDEKPSIQALERKTGYIMTDNGRVTRAYQSTYKRHGILNLFALCVRVVVGVPRSRYLPALVSTCCLRDEGRPLGAVFQEMASNRSKLHGLRILVVSVGIKGETRFHQARIAETNKSEPLMKRRKSYN